MATTTPKPATAKPQSQATSYASKKQQEELIRLGAFVMVVALMAFPFIPSPLFGIDWLTKAAPSLKILLEPLPPEPLDLMLFTLAPQPAGQWLYWALSAFLAFVALTLLMHLSAISAQRTRPLSQPRTYLMLTIPASTPLRSADAVTLLKSLHGMVPATNPMQPALPPLMMCWNGRPQRRIQQGFSIADAGATTISLQKRLQAVTSGTKAVATEDPLLFELQPGRYLCVAEARAVAGDTLPIAIVGKEQTLLAALLSSLAPQTGVFLSSVRIVQEPIPDRLWRLDVLAFLERMKLDIGAEEQQALKAKASGPAFRSRLLLLAVSDDPQAGRMQVQTMSAALSASTQSVGMSSQRLQAGAVQVFPAVVPPRRPFPKLHRWIGLVFGVLIALLLGGLLWRFGLARAEPLLWAIPPLTLPLPVLLLAALWRKRTDADLQIRHTAFLKGVLSPRNPRVVPLWWPWLGRN